MESELRVREREFEDRLKVAEAENKAVQKKLDQQVRFIKLLTSYIHKITPFSHEGRQKLQKPAMILTYSTFIHLIIHARRF